MISFNSCRKKKKEGCTSSCATNYDPDAEKDDGSCKGCYSPFAKNYCSGVLFLNGQDGSCQFTGIVECWVDCNDSLYDGIVTVKFDGQLEGSISECYSKGTAGICNIDSLQPIPTLIIKKDFISYGNSPGKSFVYLAESQNSIYVWSGTITLSGVSGNCVAVQLTQ